MPRSLPAEEIREEYEEAVQLVEAADEIELITASLGVDQQLHLHEYTLPDVVGLGQSLGTRAFYAVLEERDDGTPEWARLYFFHQDIAHVQYIESEELAQIRESETEEQADELERKRDLAEEILNRYANLISDAQEYRLKHNVEDMRMDRLFQLQDRLQEEKEQKEREESIDEELEQDLANALYQNDQFDRQFNQTDTEMLLRQMDIEFDDERVRIEEVHRQAKSLLKVNG